MTRTQTYINVGLTALFMFFVSMIFAMPASAHGNEATTTKKAKVDATCMQTAVDTREDALIEAWDTFTETMHTALEARATALHTAWGMADGTGRVKALRDAWKAWKTDRKDAHTELRGDRKAAWDAFKNTVKTSCKITLPKDEALEKDSSGSIAI